MARRGSRGGGGRTAKSKSRRAEAAPAPAEIEVVEESAGSSIDDAIVIATGVLIIVAILMIDYAWAKQYGPDGGVLF